ncbi:MAG: ATPase domain-containing protein [Methanoregula sp.]|nr:ATPase domain-containing protein [Methanoregula sp.]
MQDFASKKMPTGISSLDPILEGGVPPGSVILFLGDLGAGSNEFVYSSMVNLLDAKSRGALQDKPAPEELRYITFTRLKDDVKQEIVNSLHVDNVNQLVDSIQFDDLSELYFDTSVVPDEWYSHSDILTRMQKRAGHENVLVQLSDVINRAKPQSLIIMDSVTDIATQSNTPNSWSNLTGFFRGLQRVSKERGLTCYLLLTQGILNSMQEKELSDIADAVMLFKWEESTGSRRQRIMYFEKFRGVMPHLEERDLVKFAVRISTTSGFEVSNIRVVI